MEARGYQRTTQTAANANAASQNQQSDEAARAAVQRADQEAVAKQQEQARTAEAQVTPARFAAARERCRAKSGNDPVCDSLTAADVIQSEADAAKEQQK